MAKYRSKGSREVDAVVWRGDTGIFQSPKWLTSAFLLSKEHAGSIKHVQGSDEGELRLSGGGIRLIQPGEYVVCEGGKVRVMSKEGFEGIYDKVERTPAEDIKGN